ncbi:hypothetical protein PHYSODRAFT_285383 [Phytophthora sojae]|uniref:RxLR effector protein n=2 Tax=Phytophthora sojae TaxID=67593 RepID=G4Z564_PHYSP|nr:hypothetical protein PHYSODRAFT_285383 [Phytophthora sojae]AEK81208.1 Avh343 [Phytophthora sojae]AEK81210.1 Avh343 [Phytophthora sojae]EGZ20207.1 hypothetical protein PHYSODRAFT_285383 [Phytophthora sojae]|eukprot:XP_009522924.1 hypothetical protein PHYSODRAFT_285383 [Phytophthora sojae]
MHFLLLLLFAILSTSDATVATEGQTSILQANTQRLLTKGDAHDAETEERGVLSASLAKIKGMFGKNKNIALDNKVNSLRKDPGVAAALESPALKKLETAVEKDPRFFSNLRSHSRICQDIGGYGTSCVCAGEVERQDHQERH